MAVLPVLTYPHPLLKQKTPETDLDHFELRAVLDILVETMQHHPACVGLAAPQVGHLLRCIVVDTSLSPRSAETHGLLQLVNPRITEATQWKAGREGCLSFPDLLANVKRAQRIRVTAFNERKEILDMV